MQILPLREGRATLVLDSTLCRLPKIKPLDQFQRIVLVASQEENLGSQHYYITSLFLFFFLFYLFIFLFIYNFFKTVIFVTCFIPFYYPIMITVKKEHVCLT